MQHCDRSTKSQKQLDSLKEHSDEDQSLDSRDLDDDYAEYLKTDPPLIPKLNNYKKISRQNTVASKELIGNLNCDFTTSKA
jgi:hypothetical protein